MTSIREYVSTLGRAMKRLSAGRMDSKGAYDRMVEQLKAGGYRIEHESRGEILGAPLPEQIVVIYLSDPPQTRPPTKYTSGDILSDRPSKVSLIDMGNGKSATLSLKK